MSFFRRGAHRAGPSRRENADRPAAHSSPRCAGGFFALVFTVTVINFVRERDGRTISTQEAVALANDYGQAAALAKYVIFERGGHTHWPACSRKLGLARQVAEIRAL